MRYTPRQRPLALSLKSILHSRAVLVVSILLCAGLFFQLVKIVAKSTSTDREIALLQEESDKLADEYQRLERLSTILESDYFAEREARTKLGYKKPGEQAVIIVASDEQGDTGQDESARSNRFAGTQDTRSHETEGDEPPSPARLWWRYFFGY
ncbi:MAG: septum formation initiator family protein [Patescibacteria group bacterium]